MSFSAKVLIFACAAACSAAAFAAPRRLPAQRYVPIVENFRINAAVIVENDASKDEIAAARTLARTLEKTAERGSVSVSRKSDFKGGAFPIYLSKDPCAKSFSAAGDLDGVLRFDIAVKKNGAQIRYPQGRDAMNAVGLFLKRVCGVKFYAPGAIGAEIPKQKNLLLEISSLSLEPSYISKYLGLNSHALTEFARLNGENPELVGFPHNLPNIISADIAKAHPDWLAMRSGRRLAHSAASQIDFLNADAREFVKDYALKFFDENPDKKILSLGYADSALFDDTPATRALVGPQTPHGYENYSDLFFGFLNKIAEPLKAEHPDKFVYVLAYLYTEAPPSFKVSDNISVFVCSDRGNHFLPAERKTDNAILQGWKDVGVKLLGIYEYNYGNMYFIPRNTAEYMADAIVDAYKIGARGYTCESFPNWAYDGHKFWMTANLLEDAAQNPAALEADYFENFYKEAAVPVEKFFDEAKAAWNARTDKPMWLTLYKRDVQAELFPPARLNAMETALRDAENAADTAAVRLRVRELRMAFDITKAFVKTYELEKKLWSYGDITPANRAAAADTLEAVAISKVTRKILLDKYRRNTLYPEADYGIWEKLDYLDPSEMYAARLAGYSETGGNVLKDPSMLAAGGKNAAWRISSESAAHLDIGVRKVSEGSAKEAFKMSSWISACAFQYAPAKAETEYDLRIDVSGKLGIGAVFYAQLSFFDARGAMLSIKRLRLPACENFKNRKIEIFAEAPKGAVRACAALFSITMRDTDFVFVNRAELLPVSKNK